MCPDPSWPWPAPAHDHRPLDACLRAWGRWARAATRLGYRRAGWGPGPTLATPERIALHLDQAIARLDPPAQALLTARYLHGRELAPLAATLRISTRTLRRRLRAIEQRLVTHLEGGSDAEG
jgi:DNA-directed RNA polymerase specialized sigma24 family protein